MPKYICVNDDNDCSNPADSLEKAFKWLQDETECLVEECTFYEVKEVKVEVKIIAVPSIVKKEA